MTLSELINYLEQGREIEFNLYDSEYFMSILYLDNLTDEKYYIWDNTQKYDIIIGSMNDILSYKFNGNISLKENIEKFSFRYIL